MRNINNIFWRLYQRYIHNNEVDPTAWISSTVKLDYNITIGAYCIIGANAEHKKQWGVNKGVHIGSNSIITGHCTIDGGVEIPTLIGRDTFMMKGGHIGHDVQLGNECVLAPHVILGGHVHVVGCANFGMGAIVHQRIEVPQGVMIGMNSTITKTSTLLPYTKYVGSPVKGLGINHYSTGTLTDEEINEYQRAWLIKKS